MRRETRRYYDSTKVTFGEGGLPLGDRAGGRVSYKTYPRFPARELDVPAAHPMTEGWPSAQRLGGESGDVVGLPFAELSFILRWAAGMKNRERDAAPGEVPSERMYPSAGRRFPVEIYVFSWAVPSLPDGLHHYDVRHDMLEQLMAADLRAELTSIVGDQLPSGWSAVVCLTGVLSRSEVFADNAYRLALIEAGRISQNMGLLAERGGHQCRMVPVFDAGRLEETLDLTGDEIPLCLLEVR